VRAAVGQQGHQKVPTLPRPAVIVTLGSVAAGVGFVGDPDGLVLAAALIVSLLATGRQHTHEKAPPACVRRGGETQCVRVIRPGMGKQEQRGRTSSGYRRSRRAASERWSRRAYRNTR
jgi:hypothetical protein